MSMIDSLIQVSDAYREALALGGRKLSTARLSTLVFGDGKVLPELAAKSRDITTGRLETALVWFSANWPADAAWPKGVARPDLNEPAA